MKNWLAALGLVFGTYTAPSSALCRIDNRPDVLEASLGDIVTVFPQTNRSVIIPLTSFEPAAGQDCSIIIKGQLKSIDWTTYRAGILPIRYYSIGFYRSDQGSPIDWPNANVTFTSRFSVSLEVKFDTAQPNAERPYSGDIDLVVGTIDTPAPGGFKYYPVHVTGSVTLVPCSSPDNVTVALGDIDSESISADSGPVRDLPLAVDCYRGTPASISIDGSPASPGGSSFALTPDSQASGVGVQILVNDRIVTPGTPIALPSDPSTAKFQARYSKVGAITAGSANAVMSYTLTYN